MIAAFDVLHSASSRREQRRKYFETLFFPSRNRKAAPTVAFALLTQRPPCSFFFLGPLVNRPHDRLHDRPQLVVTDDSAPHDCRF